MRILVNDTAAVNGGALSVLNEFYQYAKNADNGKKIDWVFLLSEKLFEETSNIKIIILEKGRLKWIKRLWIDNYLLKKICVDNNIDGVISFQNTASFTCKLPQLVYMHQIIPFQKEKNFSFSKKNEFLYAVYQHIVGKLIKHSMRVANLVVVQASWIKQMVIEQTGIKSENVIVNGINYIPTEIKTSNRRVSALSAQFFYPAFECCYKNQDIVRFACAILERNGVRANVILTVESNETESDLIHNIGSIPHESVMRLMMESTLIFPSYIETVGLPLVEGMSVNALILAADCQYAHETLGDYPNAYYFDPFNPAELANLMGKVITGEITKKVFDYIPKMMSDWDNVVSTFTDYIVTQKLEEV